jgi:hypothetical protein
MNWHRSHYRLIAVLAIGTLQGSLLHAPPAVRPANGPYAALSAAQDQRAAALAIDPRSSLSLLQPWELRSLSGPQPLAASMAGIAWSRPIPAIGGMAGSSYQRPVGRSFSLQAQHCLLIV